MATEQLGYPQENLPPPIFPPEELVIVPGAEDSLDSSVQPEARQLESELDSVMVSQAVPTESTQILEGDAVAAPALETVSSHTTSIPDTIHIEDGPYDLTPPALASFAADWHAGDETPATT